MVEALFPGAGQYIALAEHGGALFWQMVEVLIPCAGRNPVPTGICKTQRPFWQTAHARLFFAEQFLVRFSLAKTQIG